MPVSRHARERFQEEEKEEKLRRGLMYMIELKAVGQMNKREDVPALLYVDMFILQGHAAAAKYTQCTHAQCPAHNARLTMRTLTMHTHTIPGSQCWLTMRSLQCTHSQCAARGGGLGMGTHSLQGTP